MMKEYKGSLPKENIHQMDEVTTVKMAGQFYDIKSGKYPSGNCFSVSTADGSKNFRIVNFGYENLKLLLNMKIVAWPVQVYALDESTAIIADSRIPDRFYDNMFCTICCPFDLLPLPQQMNRSLLKERGSIRDLGDGIQSRTIGYDIESGIHSNGEDYSGIKPDWLQSGTMIELAENGKARTRAYLLQFLKAELERETGESDAAFWNQKSIEDSVIKIISFLNDKEYLEADDLLIQLWLHSSKADLVLIVIDHLRRLEYDEAFTKAKGLLK